MVLKKPNSTSIFVKSPLLFLNKKNKFSYYNAKKAINSNKNDLKPIIFIINSQLAIL